MPVTAEEEAMAVTGACAEIVYLNVETLTPDYEAPIAYSDFAAVLEDTEPVGAEDYVEIDPRGNDAFSS